MDIKVRETARYLGYKNQLPDEQTLTQIKTLMFELEQVCSPRYICKEVPISIQNNTINFDFFSVESKNLAKNLKNCEKAIFFAATLGTEADFLIRRYSKTSMTKSVIINSCASALIEEFANISQKQIASTLNNEYLRPRFSPGYGDFELKHQKDIINLLNTSKKIGLTLTDSLILMPIKSITAVMGISHTQDNCLIEGCEVCTKKDCQFRRN
ncbi:MAG: vitamin B12 dependent-methionine synthase activation domain-containing protein [Clostridia bacterium]